MASPDPRAMRSAAAQRLRALAHRLEPPRRRSPAPLVRFGGRWWNRHEPFFPVVAEELGGPTNLVRQMPGRMDATAAPSTVPRLPPRDDDSGGPAPR